MKTTWLAAQPKNNKNLAIKEGQEVWYNVEKKLKFHCIYNLNDVRYNLWSAWGLCTKSCGHHGIRREKDKDPAKMEKIAQNLDLAKWQKIATDFPVLSLAIGWSA